MLAFTCDNCGQLIFFENTRCLNCSHPLGFVLGLGLITLADVDDGSCHRFGGDPDLRWRRCANADLVGCNWLVPVSSPDPLCRSCELTRTLPDFDDPDSFGALTVAETAKRRLLFQLGRVGLPVVSRRDDPLEGLAFDFLSSRFTPITTGHASGVITIDIAESDDAHREWLRQTMGESYRTMLGHLRHEIGHYFWMIFAHDAANLYRIRNLFGDDTIDYAAALDLHYRQGPPPEWETHYVSNYASTHPWEDWAETFAHYLHIRGTIESAAAFGVTVQGPPALAASDRAQEFRSDPARVSTNTRISTFGDVIAEWIPLTYALNEINRAMGKRPLYPFVLAPDVRAKLQLVHELCSNAAVTAAGATRTTPAGPAPHLG